jgi:hypothetical protein
MVLFLKLVTFYNLIFNSLFRRFFEDSCLLFATSVNVDEQCEKQLKNKRSNNSNKSLYIFFHTGYESYIAKLYNIIVIFI